MHWDWNSSKKIYIPGLTENKELKNYIKIFCSRPSIGYIGHVCPFPGESSHFFQIATHNRYSSLKGKPKHHVEFVILHGLEFGRKIDSVSAKLKSNGVVYFSYDRSILIPTGMEEWINEPYYLDSELIDWNEVAEKLKIKIIECL